MDRRLTLVALGFVSAALAYAIGFPMAAAGVGAGLPIGLVNYRMMNAVRGQWEAASNTSQLAGVLAQRTTLRLLLSAGALLLASLLGPEFLIGALVGITLEVLSYFGDAMLMFFGNKE